MGYSTDFKGELKFERELTGSELAKVRAFLEEDCRDHPDWGNTNLYYVDLELLDDFSGLKWNGAEKTYGMVEIVNMIITNMKKEVPDFSLTGKLFAQGEDIDDRWELSIKDGVAIKTDAPQTGDKIVCPHCEQHFYL